MAPPGRKRVKPNPISPDISSPNSERSNSRKSLWYPNVWPSKAAAVTEVARESISSGPASPLDLQGLCPPTLQRPALILHLMVQLWGRQRNPNRTLPHLHQGTLLIKKIQLRAMQ
ncbi:hypothetical protein BDV18DRAFT_64380 [Aspergillus unguis]